MTRITIADDTQIFGSGVLVNSKQVSEEGFYGLEFKGGVNVLNKDGSIYATLHTNRDTHEFYSVKNNKKYIPVIRGGYPDYHIFIADAIKLPSGEFNIRIDQEWKRLYNRGELTYKTWKQFLEQDAGFVAFEKTSIKLYSLKGEGVLKIITSAENYSFDILKVDGDWAYVSCDDDCEGCGNDGKKIKGWVKILDNKKLLVDLRFVC